MEAKTHALLCQEIESELRELCLECRKKFPIIKEYTERAILKIRHHKDLVEQDGHVSGGDLRALPEFPQQEVMRAILMACETFQNKIVLLSLSCLQRLIHRRVLKDETIAVVINLMKEQATNGDEAVQLRVLQTIMATPSDMMLLNEMVVQQLVQLLYVLHNSACPSVHHTSCAGLRQLAEYFADKAATSEAAEGANPLPGDGGLEQVPPVIQRAPAPIPTVAPAQAPASLAGQCKMFYIFVQDLCVMADYDASSLSTRYAVDAGERMRIGLREGFWLSNIKFPRPLCLELLGACVGGHPEVFTNTVACFTLMRHNICAVLLKNLRGCFDFAILIRSIHLLQQILRYPRLAALLMPEMQVFLHLMLDLTTAERSPWQRATSLEFLKSICEDPATLAVLYEHGASGTQTDPGPRTFLELVNNLSKLMHQVCFSSGMDSGALLQSAANAQAPPPANPPSKTGGLSFDSAGPFSSALRGTFLGAPSLPNLGLVNSPGSVAASGHSVSGRNHGSPPNGDSAAPEGGGDRRDRRGASAGARGSRARTKLLQMMSEAEPPAIQPAFLVSLVVEGVFAIVSTVYRLLLQASQNGEAGGSDHTASGDGPGNSGANGAQSAGVLLVATPTAGLRDSGSIPLPLPHSENQIRVRDMLTDCWGSLLSALSLLLHGAGDESFLLQALHCLQTLLYCCGRLGLEQARDACLLQISRYVLPGQTPEADGEPLSGAGLSHGSAGGSMAASPAGSLNTKNVVCYKALLNFCYSFGGLLGVGGWTIALRALNGLSRVPRKGNELTVLRQGFDSLFQTTALLSDVALCEIVDALGQQIKSGTDTGEGVAMLNRLVEVCSVNLPRLLLAWDRVLQIALATCTAEHKGELRGAAAAAFCRILGQGMRKGALAAATDAPEEAQQELLKPLEGLLNVPHEDIRARICEGLLSILQASGQELHPAAWATMIHLVTLAARLELERAGLDFFLPTSLDGVALMPGDNAAALASLASADGATLAPPARSAGGAMAPASSSSLREADGRDSSAALPTVFQLLELLVHDFMEYVPPDSVPQLTACVGAFARFTRLGVNSSLTAVGFLWNVADALARYHCSSTPSGQHGLVGNGKEDLLAAAPVGSSTPRSPASFGDFWTQIFMHLRVLAVDIRPEVRNCAVKSLTSALLSHGRKVGAACYRRCLQDILIQVLAEVQDASRCSRGRASTSASGGGDFIVHHSRDTLEKQWDETMVLGIEGVRRVLSHYSEDTDVQHFAPLAYTFLLQVRTTLQTLSTEVSGAALRALVDLMRIPASSQYFAAGTITPDPALPVPAGQTSVWLLGWSLLWQMVQFCICREVPESLMETFASTLSALRATHRHLFTPAQHLILLELVHVLVTAPSFYLPASTPMKVPPDMKDARDVQDNRARLARAVELCRNAEAAHAAAHGAVATSVSDVFGFAEQSPDRLWHLSSRVGHVSGRVITYTRAPVAAHGVVDLNPSRNAEIKSLESALRDACRESDLTDEAAQASLGPTRAPTHRTMLHISSSRLQHVQGFVFALLEEAPCFPKPFLESFFLYSCCAVFLDVRVILLDTNKVALAARCLCLLVSFCRRLLLHNLAKLACGKGRNADAQRLARREALDHLEAFLAAVPELFEVLLPITSGRGCPHVYTTGLWKLAVETLLYMIEDSLPALEHVGGKPELVAAYWSAVVKALREVVSSALPCRAKADRGTSAESAFLVHALGNLLVHRILPCQATPQGVAEQAVRFLGELVALQAGSASMLEGLCTATVGGDSKHGNGSAQHRPHPLEPHVPLAYLFDLCLEPGTGGGHPAVEESVAAMTARGGRVPQQQGCLLERGVLLGTGVPVLLEQLRSVFNIGGEASAGAPLPHRADEMRFALSRLQDFHADEVVLQALLPVLQGDRAQAVCRLAGPRCITMALLPQLSALGTSGDVQIRMQVQDVLQGLAANLGL